MHHTLAKTFFPSSVYPLSLLRTIPAFAHAPTAIHRQHDTRDEAGLVTAQENSGVTAILGLAGSLAQRLLGAQEGADDRIPGGAGGHGSVDQAGSDDVDANPIRRIAGSGQPAHGDDAALGGGVGIGVEV